MTNERAQRIVDVPADTSVGDPIAPPPVDRADQESQLETAPIDDELIAAEPETASEAGPAGASVDAVQTPGDTAVLDEDGEALEESEASDDGAIEDVQTVETVEDDQAGGDEASEDDALEPVSEVVAEADREPADDEAATTERLAPLLEALLFVADEPVTPAALARALDLTPREVRRGLDDLADALREEQRGVRLQQGPDGAQLVTAPEVASTVEVFLGLEANRRLSNAALETLAIIAYRQPVTRHVIEQIRGVNSDGAVATLRARGLIEGIGRAPGPGRPLLFSTTQRFLEHFGLERPDQLPPLPDDVELPVEDGGAQLALGAAAEDDNGALDTEDTLDGDEPSASEPTAADAEESASEDADDEVIEDALDSDDEFAPFEEGDAFEDDEPIEDDPELEISDDLGELSRAAGSAFSSSSPAPSERADGPGFGD